MASSSTRDKRLAEGQSLSPTVEKNARLSSRLRAKRPIPATRREADDLFGPSARIAHQKATIPRVARLMQLGLIPQYTNEQAHELILDAMYGDDGLIRRIDDQTCTIPPNRACFECSAPATEEHHIIPVSRGGTATVPLCSACHGLVHGQKGRTDQLSALTSAGLQKARANGKRLGRPLSISPDVIERILTMRRDGYTFQAIADQLNLDGVRTTRGGAMWYSSTVWRALAAR